MFNARTPTADNVLAALDRLRINGTDPETYPGGSSGLERDLKLSSVEYEPPLEPVQTVSLATRLRNSMGAFVHMFGRAVGGFEVIATLAPDGPARAFAEKAAEQAQADLDTVKEFLAKYDGEELMTVTHILNQAGQPSHHLIHWEPYSQKWIDPHNNFFCHPTNVVPGQWMVAARYGWPDGSREPRIFPTETEALEFFVNFLYARNMELQMEHERRQEAARRKDLAV